MTFGGLVLAIEQEALAQQEMILESELRIAALRWTDVDETGDDFDRRLALQHLKRAAKDLGQHRRRMAKARVRLMEAAHG